MRKAREFIRVRSVYDPITSFLDFYAIIIIAYDMDSYEQLSGTELLLKSYGYC
jgi:hypothetical protein